MSYDFDDQSINAFIPPEECTVKYKDLDFVVKACLHLRELVVRNSDFEGLFYSKTDVVSVFRIVPNRPGQRFLLIMKAKHPESGVTYFSVDKCLPFGHSIRCAVFQSFSDALAYIMEFRTGLMIMISNYLDDFLIIAYSLAICNQAMQEFLHLCDLVGFPTAEEKTEWGAHIMIFLGMLLDGKNCVLAVPQEKCVKALNLLRLALDQKKITIKQIQNITGTLNFIHRAIVPGRTFTHSMYDKLKTKDKNG